MLEAALVVGALTVDAARGSDGPFDARIHALRGQPGQIDVACYLRALLAGSEIRRSHLQGDDRVQDPYSLRCQPQVIGACLDQLRHAALVLVREANAVTDNPLVFLDEVDLEPAGRPPGRLIEGRAASAGSEGSETPSGSIISGGNFHAEPVALAADAMAVAVAEVGAIAERRIAMLIDANVSRLPPFLTAEPGLNSGFMIAHVTAASLASENKSLAHPASVDSLPTSANQEDHVSMATFAARRLQPMIDNTATILGIELLAAAQGIEFLRPLASSPPLEAAHALLRERARRCRAIGSWRPTSSAPPRSCAAARWRVSFARLPACRRSGTRPERSLTRESGGRRRLAMRYNAASAVDRGPRRLIESDPQHQPTEPARAEQERSRRRAERRRAARPRRGAAAAAARCAGAGAARRRRLAQLVVRSGAGARRQGDGVEAVARNARPALSFLSDRPPFAPAAPLRLQFDAVARPLVRQGSLASVAKEPA